MKQSDIDCWLYTCGLLEKLNCPQNQLESQDVPPQDHPGGVDGLSQDLPANFKKILKLDMLRGAAMDELSIRIQLRKAGFDMDCEIVRWDDVRTGEQCYGQE